MVKHSRKSQVIHTPECQIHIFYLEPLFVKWNPFLKSTFQVLRFILGRMESCKFGKVRNAMQNYPQPSAAHLKFTKTQLLYMNSIHQHFQKQYSSDKFSLLPLFERLHVSRMLAVAIRPTPSDTLKLFLTISACSILLLFTNMC